MNDDEINRHNLCGNDLVVKLEDKKYDKFLSLLGNSFVKKERQSV
jgi:hypothetical protein